MRRRTRITLALILVPGVALPLVACTGTDVPPADDAAASFVAALQAGDLDGVPLVVGASVDAQTQLSEIFAPLVDASANRDHTVKVAEVGEVTTADDGTATATATLDWSWPLTRDQVWNYSTEVGLAYTAPTAAAGDDSTAVADGGWRPVWQPDALVPDLSPGERLDVDILEPDRGDILDGSDEPLMTARDVWHIGVDKTLVDGLGLESAARGVAVLVGLEPNDFFEKVKAAGDKAFVEAITIRQQDPGTDFTVDDARDIEGVVAVADTQELAPNRDFAAGLLGRAGEATKEIVDESEGTVRSGDVVGLSGLQHDYDEQLTGVPGVEVTAVHPDDGGSDVALDGGEASDDDKARELYKVDPVDGTPVATTIDRHLEQHAENVLEDVDPASAIVAIRPSTGEVLAAASGPGSEGWSTATLGKYPPGSTFKIVDALAMQRAGLTADSKVACTESLAVDGRTFTNVPGYPSSAIGDVPLSTAFAHSCNTAMIAQRGVVTQEALTKAAADLGLSNDEDVLAGIGAAAYLGSVPSEAGETEHAASMIGQGKIEASPLGMATVVASVAAGHRVEPVLVRGDAKDDAAAEGSGVTEGEAAVLRDLMGGVVSEGSADILQDIPGIVGAKTGTAQYGDGSRQHVWMVAIVDDLAVAAFIEDGEYGSTTAGPVLHDFLEGL